MRNHLLKSIFISLILMMGISNAWAASTVQGGYIYFDATKSGWSVSDVQMVVGHNSYSAFYGMSNISNTSLYYLNVSGWNDATYFAFANGCSTWGAEGSKYDDRKSWISGKYTAAKTNYTLNSNNYYLFYASTSSNNASITTSSPAGYLGSDKTYTALNYTQTLKQELSTDNGVSYAASTAALATVKVSSYKLKSKNTTESSSGTIASGSSETTCSAARTATVTYTVTNVESGYTFVGWYDGDTEKSTSATYTYQATEAKTITARFAVATEEEHEVAVSYMCGTTKVADGATAYVGVETEKSFTAPTVTGYKFNNWTIGDGIDLKAGTASNETITVVTKSASSDYTLVANYEEVKETVYFINIHNWTNINAYAYTPANAEWPGVAATKEAYTIAGYDVYSYTATQGQYANVIFNGTGGQTADLTWTEGVDKYYIHSYGSNTGWYTKEDAETVLATPLQYYLIGNMNGWTIKESHKINDTGSEEKEFTLPWNVNAGTHEFKITETSKTNWYGYDKLTKHFNEVSEGKDGEGNPNGNIVVNAPAQGTIYVTFNIETKNITLESDILTEVKCYLMGNGDWVNGVEMEYDSENGQYILLCHHISAPFKFKLGDEWSDQVENNTENGVTWTDEDSDGNFDINLPEGDYNFYFKKDSKKAYIEVSTPAHTRTVPAGYYATVCLSQNIIKVVGATLFEVAGKEGNKVIFDEVLTPIAGMPYIFLAEENTISFYCGIETAATPGDHKSLHGTFEDMVDADLDGMYMVQNNKIVKCAATGCNIPKNRAYFDGTELDALGVPHAPMPGRRRITMGAEGENTTTGLNNITNGENTTIKVIENGQLIIIRNGEKFNAQGIKL